ncbi:DinB family protein [Aureisphaera galaxeae]|uniref:DinB family protein n=1 Tax=Aureisphaera galaxeae TaxID=1538023 RepID=UPI00235019F8|nr:DinB family protein [Aureisphaera galaxeae]MDC8005996.1 DinB family protein [Aureisphaera galaxeae]
MKYNLNEAISVLERTPSVMRSLLSGLPDVWTQQNEGGDSWSPYDVIGHLVHGEKTDWMPRLEIVLSDGPKKTFDPYDRFAQFKMSEGKTLEDLLGEFESLRTSNLDTLRSKNLTEQDLSKQANHPELGPVELREMLAAWVVHDLGHIAQISRVMAKQYKNEVGPWPKYLTILNHTPKE